MGRNKKPPAQVKLDVVMVPVGKLRPAEYNPRRMTEKEADDLRASIREFGLVDPLIVNDLPPRENVVIGGHQRLRIAQEMGLATIPCVFVSLDEAQEKRLNLRLNKNVGSWDWDALAGFDTPLLLDVGFTADELSEGFDIGLDGNEHDDLDGLRAPPKGTAVTRSGDVWVLGDHRLACGDSLDGPALSDALDGRMARMVFTDPPWNANIGGLPKPGGTREGLVGDDVSADDFAVFLGSTARRIAEVVVGDVYVVMGAAVWATLDESLRAESLHPSGVLVWVKDSFVIGRSNYHHRFEPIWYGWAGGAASSFNGRRDLDDVWEIPRPNASPEHPTMKPVALCARAIENSSLVDDLVLDVFAGAGSTLLACEKLKRRCAAVEIDPCYCDVIVQRWEAMTGRAARLLGTEMGFADAAAARLPGAPVETETAASTSENVL